MSDMLVRLYELPDAAEAIGAIARRGIVIRRPVHDERDRVVDWVRTHFTPGWAAECATAFVASPPSCFIAMAGRDLVGFACHDCTRRNYFGPTGVAEPARKQGTGLGLLLTTLHAMHASGYAYAIIGGVGPAAFYAKAVGATLIDGSTPGIYRQ